VQYVKNRCEIVCAKSGEEGVCPAQPFLRDNSARRRIKAYSTFASFDRGLNAGASKRKLGSRVKLIVFSGW
jgi:hypothetical protein